MGKRLEVFLNTRGPGKTWSKSFDEIAKNRVAHFAERAGLEDDKDPQWAKLLKVSLLEAEVINWARTRMVPEKMRERWFTNTAHVILEDGEAADWDNDAIVDAKTKNPVNQKVSKARKVWRAPDPEELKTEGPVNPKIGVQLSEEEMRNVLANEE